MSNILKVTTPVTGYDNTVNKQGQTQQPDNLSIKNPVTPDKVSRPDGRQQAGNEQTGNQGVTHESNFGNFVQSLRELPLLRELMNKMIFTGMGNLVEAGVGKGTAADIEALFQMLEMSPDEVTSFLKSQMNGANRMQGPLFDLMRQVMGQAETVELKQGILDFLKKYNDMSSGKHLMQNIKGNLEDIQGYVDNDDWYTTQTKTLQEPSAGHRIVVANVSYRNQEETGREILKEEIIPFLGKYVSDTRDMGKIRDLISLLAFNTSRYESGNVDNVAQAFQRLLSFPAFQKKLPDMTADQFRDMLMNVDFEKAAGKTEWTDKLLNIIDSGIKGEAGAVNKEAFLNIMNGLLINESVYMPVMHVMLPMILNGVPVFSEIWVDPDEDSGNPGSREKGVKLLIKFDMKDVGFFDMMMYYEKGKMDMLIHYPDHLSEHESEIRKGIMEIMEKNNMAVEYLAVEPGRESIPVSAAFPKIFERRNSVNVTI